MAKTLIIKYAPRIGSNTEKLLEHFKIEVSGKTDIKEIDIAENLPPLFDKLSLNAYTKKYYGGMELNNEEEKSLQYIYDMVKEVKEADVIVVANPMYNFSVPAAVKAWIDSIVVAGETFQMGPDGLKGLLAGKKAIHITTSGSSYDKSPMKEMNHNTSLIASDFGFMGLETKTIWAQGMNSPDAEKIVEEKFDEVKKIIAEVY